MSSRLLITSLAALSLAACGGSGPATETAANTDAAAPSAPVEPAPAGDVTDAAETTPAVTAEAAPEATSEATPETPPAMTADATPDPVADNGPDPAIILAALGGDYVNADLTNGARQFRRCQSCHTLNNGGRHTVGPNLFGVMNSPAAGQERFRYSRQLTDANLVWDAETMDAWLENPRGLVPGNRMSFVGLRDADARRDVIAYIAVETAE